MKKKICLTLVFLFSFLNIGAFPQGKAEDLFYSVESRANEFSDFYENGVKVEYKSKKSKDDLLEELKFNIENQYANNFIKGENSLRLNLSDAQVTANIYENKGYLDVEIILINQDSKKNLSTLMKELTKLQTNNIYDVQYFKYVKGRIDNIDDALDKIENTKELKDINTLYIHNGYVGTAILYNGGRVNFTVSTYDTGSYLIIGVPIIFTTY